MNRHRSRSLFAGAAVVTALLAACGDDLSSTAPSPAVTGPGGAVVDPVTSGPSLVWCDGLRAMDRQAADPAGATSAAIDALERMRLDPVGGSEPWLDSLIGAFTAASTSGESVLIGPTAGDRIDARLAAATLHAVAADGCGWPTIDVDAVDFGYGGLPSRVEAGTTRFRLTNTAPSEVHELVVLRKHDAAMTTADLVALGPGMLASADLLGGTMIEPGATSAAVLDLTPGAYVAICFIPTAADPDGTPHLAHGMVAEFTVPEG